MTVLAIDKWESNAALIADVSTLGYLDGHVLDPTYGGGNFWTEFTPWKLTACDLNPEKSPLGMSVDFRHLPWKDRWFDVVVFDPPYKLNGTPDPYLDERYGVDVPTKWQDRMALIIAGVKECARVTKTYLLVKCQDQVCSGVIRWQTDHVTDAAINMGMDKVDRFDFLSYRPQPSGRSQQHARRNSSTLLVFRKNERR